MAKDDIPVKESTNGGVPVTDVRSAQAALQGMMNTRNEQSSEDLEETETTEEVSAQDTESESVETEVANPDGLSADDLVDQDQVEGNEELSTYTVKVDGKDVEVTQEELLAGYSRQADYTRKSQVLSEQRQKADAELAATQQERQRLTTQLEQLSSINTSELETLEKQNWSEIEQRNPTEYLLQKNKLNDLREKQRVIESEQNNIRSKAEQEFKEKWDKSLAENKKVIETKIPSYFDPDKGVKIQNNIRQFMLNEGFKEGEIDSMVDARSVNTAYKAMLYDNLVKAKISKKKSKNVPRVTRPGSPATKGEISGDKVKAQRARLRKSGHLNDARSVIESLLNN